MSTVTEPGIYEMDEATYHGDPVPGGSLSSTGARKLLSGCPAKFRYEQTHPVHKDVFDFGTAAHRLVLGTGAELDIIDAACIARLASLASDTKTAKLYAETAAKGDPEAWNTSAAKAARDESRAAGRVPLLKADYAQVVAMADALRSTWLASAALDPKRGGKPEQSLFGQDEASGVWLRARLDWMPDPHATMRPVIFDYKTTANAHPDNVAKSMANYGYDVQAAFYADLYYQLTGVDAPFLLIAQEKEAPYLVSVCQPDADAIRAGREKYRRAIEIFRDCAEAGVWPGYGDEIATISLPPWARAREDY